MFFHLPYPSHIPLSPSSYLSLFSPLWSVLPSPSGNARHHTQGGSGLVKVDQPASTPTPPLLHHPRTPPPRPTPRLPSPHSPPPSSHPLLGPILLALVPPRPILVTTLFHLLLPAPQTPSQHRTPTHASFCPSLPSLSSWASTQFSAVSAELKASDERFVAPN